MVKIYSSTNPGSFYPKTGRTVAELTGLLKAIAKYIEGICPQAYAQTAYALLGEREKAIEAGCNDYISIFY